MSQTTPFPVESGQHFSVGHLGSFAGLHQYSFSVPALGNKQIPGKVFLKDQIGLTGVEMSYNTFPPGVGMPFLHAHKENEEVYLVISGQGEFMVDETIFPIQEGSVVRVAPAGARAYRNTGTDALHFIVLQVKENSLSAATIEDGIVLEGAMNWQS